MALKLDAGGNVRVTLRLPPEMYAEIVALADQEQRAINGQLVYMLRQSLDGGKSTRR